MMQQQIEKQIKDRYMMQYNMYEERERKKQMMILNCCTKIQNDFTVRLLLGEGVKKEY